MARLVESTIKQINRRLKEVENVFGQQSTEYHTLKNIIYQNLGEFDFFIKYSKGSISISRSKKALQAANEWGELVDMIDDIWGAFKKQGTLKEMLSQYSDLRPSEIKKDESLLSEIREISRNNYVSSYVDDDIYTEINRLLEEESEKYGTDDFDQDFYSSLSDIHDLLTEKGISRDYKYAMAEKQLHEAKLRHEEWLLKRQMQNASEPSDLGSNDQVIYDLC